MMLILMSAYVVQYVAHRHEPHCIACSSPACLTVGRHIRSGAVLSVAVGALEYPTKKNSINGKKEEFYFTLLNAIAIHIVQLQRQIVLCVHCRGKWAIWVGVLQLHCTGK